MSSTLKKIKKIFHYSSSTLLILGMVLVTGFLSFSGMLLLNSSIFFAISCFFLAGIIEGEVYAQNIKSSLFKIFTTTYWTDAIIEQTLEELIAANKDQLPPFLQEYRALQNYIQHLEHHHDHSTKNKKLLKDAQRHLKWKRRYFRDFILNKASGPFDKQLEAAFAKLLVKEQVDDIESLRSNIHQKINQKIWLSRAAWILNIAAGISCALVGIEVAQSSMAVLISYFGITISGAALSASIFGLAILGALGYTLIIHNTITDIIKNDSVRQWAHKSREFFKRKQQGKISETLARYYLRVILGSIGISIVIGLGVFATIATAGTWWYAAKAGARFISWLTNIASGLRTVAVSLMAITTLLFSLVNSLQTVEELLKVSFHKIKVSFQKLINKYIDTPAENLIQRLNPFRFIILTVILPFKYLIFIAHLFSMGVTGDRLNKVPPLVTSVLSAGGEFLEDSHYFFHIDDTTDHHHHNHNDNNHNTATADQKDNNAISCTCSHQESKEVTDEHHHHKENQEPHTHHHAHGEIIMGTLLAFIKIALAPLYLLAISWDWLASKGNSSTDKQLTFKLATTKIVHGLTAPKETNLEKPLLSLQTLTYEKEKRIQKIIDQELPQLKENDKIDFINRLHANLNEATQQNSQHKIITFFSDENINQKANLIFKRCLTVANQYLPASPSLSLA